tara:strand:+ start:810 stop:1334 length:525 start_codon:yes stop_codon:yes gene_type:complete
MTKLKTINIKGKKYVEVNERLKYFRENHPDYSLTTEIIQCTEEHCVIKATITYLGGAEIATGHAHEVRSANFINKTSFVEVCETSAWGRALANFGIGIDENVASAQEVANAIAQTEVPKKKTVDSSRESLTSSKFDAMMKAVRDGESLVVKQRMDNYSMTEDQRKLLMSEIEKQ